MVKQKKSKKRLSLVSRLPLIRPSKSKKRKYKKKTSSPPGRKKTRPRLRLGSFFLGLFLGFLILGSMSILLFEKKYQGKVYPGVKILGTNFGGQDPSAIVSFLNEKNFPFENLIIVFEGQEKTATLSGDLVNLGFDSRLSAHQAFLIGRSGGLFSQIIIKHQAITSGLELSPFFKWENELLEKTLNNLSEDIDFSPQNALFEFQNGRVTAFRVSKRGKKLNTQKTLASLEQKLSLLVKDASFSASLTIPLEVEMVEPKVTTAQANDLGIEASLGRGVSYFGGSSKERVHNIALSSSVLHGRLLAPGETLSLNGVLGDISPTTGYQTSYIIKEGKTVLGDGGGVCQTSTTLFRAALNSGLQIIERHPHSYRVSYYERGGFSPGLDATVFDPVDLKFENNTPAHVLIQTNLNYSNASLTFEFYGKRNDRQVNISKVKIWDQQPPPEDKYIDDPTLPKGEIKQIDWKAWGAKTSFNYKVTRGGEVLQEKSFYSNFKPWQAVFLRGTKE